MPAFNQLKTTILKLRRQKKNGEKTVLVTAYDVWQSQLADQAGIEIILVGDSLGMTTLGYDSTNPVTMEDMIRHASAVNRGSKNAFLVGDMPFMSYQVSNEAAILNAGRFITAGMDCVKIEGAMVERVKAIVDSGILVMSHLGLTPQTKAKLGGYRVQGKSEDEYKVIRDQALRLQDAGCAFLLLEAMPKISAALLAKELEIPVYGIGAGDEVDGQLVIFHDLVGLFFEFKSKFVKRYCEAGLLIKDALHDYADEVRRKQFPSSENFYTLKANELEKLLSDSKWKYEKNGASVLK